MVIGAIRLETRNLEFLPRGVRSNTLPARPPEIDAERDCPVYTAMSGTDTWQQKLCASSFAMFLRILAVTREVAQGLDMDDDDMDNEHVFREAIGPWIREYDPAALKAGHWI